jgi:hypothetical protein
VQTAAGHTQGYHVGPQVTKNSEARAAFNPRPLRSPFDAVSASPTPPDLTDARSTRVNWRRTVHVTDAVVVLEEWNGRALDYRTVHRTLSLTLRFAACTRRFSMSELIRKKTTAGHVQGYHVGSSVTSNSDARAAFNPRPSRFLPVEQCPSFAGAAKHYREGRSLDWTWNRDVASESGLPLEVVDEAVKRHVHRQVLAEFGDPRETEAFEAAVAATRAAEADRAYVYDIQRAADHARHAVAVKLLAGRASPGAVFEAAVDESVFDAARN